MAASQESVPHAQGAESARASWNEVLLDEMHKLRPGLFASEQAVGFSEPETAATQAARAANLRELYGKVGRLPDAQGLSALCFSGGGIRSATFNLGVLQGLARLGILGRFDYLSSVSGGGYIASWLRAWMHREGTQPVIESLVQSPAERQENPLAPEPEPLDNLREYSNYLTPQMGIASVDTWGSVAIVLRNLLLNWLVMLPMLAVVVTIPQWCLLVIQSAQGNSALGYTLLWLALGMELLGSLMTYRARRFWKDARSRQQDFVVQCVLPLYLATVLLATAALCIKTPWRLLWGFAILWCLIVPGIGWGVSELRWRKAQRATALPGTSVGPGYELLALLVSGAVGGGLLVALVHAWFAWFAQRPVLYVICAVPLLLGLYLLARALFLAVASLSEGGWGHVRGGSSDDADREWWGRLSGWLLLLACLWLVLSACCLLGNYLLAQYKDRLLMQWLDTYLPQILAGVGGLSGVVASLLGKSGDTASGSESGTQHVSRLKQVLMMVAGPLCILAVVMLLARGTAFLGKVMSGIPQEVTLGLPWDPAVGGQLTFGGVCRFLLVPVSCALLSLVLGRVVNVNRFSLHGVYRNRLIRAYLGASHTERIPDPFTGFDPGDNLRLHQLWKEPPADNPRAAATRPLPVINATLNLVRSQEKLAWQQRKGESFAMTPFYCGNFFEGYRRSEAYGGFGGISLGTAVTISGAAANPNMGYSSSPLIGFLMTLCNARLGAWLGNTNRHGDTTYFLPGPRQALWPLIAELFGLTSARSRYINLSDGGHFDNLGLYEMVLRRCRYICLSDAGCDPAHSFEDLGNALRKIRIDFGIPITFERKLLIQPRSAKESGLYCALGVIHYREADGAEVQDGHLLYLKPTLHGRGEACLPYDVYSYAQAFATFPHETTADQWFSEAQFESYRALGLHTIEQIRHGTQAKDFVALWELVKRYMQSQEREEA